MGVEQDSAAAKAGLEPRDVIEKVDDKRIANFSELKEKYGFNNLFIIAQDVSHARGAAKVMEKVATKSGWNACHFAAHEGDLQTMQVLIEAGAETVACAAMAHAPDPHARVSPAPRSHMRAEISSRPRTCAIS